MTPKQEPALDSQGEETHEKEVISRSGRKIKPKRFADFSSSDGPETPLDKNGKYSLFLLYVLIRSRIVLISNTEIISSSTTDNILIKHLFICFPFSKIYD